MRRWIPTDPAIAYWFTVLDLARARLAQVRRGPDDRGLKTIEVAIWAGIVAGAATALGAWLLGKIEEYKGRVP